MRIINWPGKCLPCHSVVREFVTVRAERSMPLGALPRELQVAESTKAKDTKPSISDKSDEEAQSNESKPTTAALKAENPLLTKDAADVEDKSVVEQMEFKSKSNVKVVCAELTANLKAQGWSNAGADMRIRRSSSARAVKHPLPFSSSRRTVAAE